MAAMVPSFYLTFGVVVIPVKSYPAARRERIEFEQLHAPCAKKGQPARLEIDRRCTVCTKDAKEGEVVKGYSVGVDQYVLVTQQELDDLHPEKTKTMEIEGFFPFEQIAPQLLKESSYLGPVDRASVKAFHLLQTVMQRTKKVALVRYVHYGREKIGVIRSLSNGVLMLHECYYVAEVRSFESQDRVDLPAVELKKGELELGLLLVERQTLKRVDLAQYEDRYRDRVTALIESKVAKVPPPKFEARPAPALMPDLIEALKRSLAAKVKEKPVVKKPEKIRARR